MHLQKSRGLAGSGAEPFVASLAAKGDAFQWTTHPLSENADKIVEFSDQGKSVRDIEELTGIPKSTVQRILDKQLPTKRGPTSRAGAGRRVPASQS